MLIGHVGLQMGDAREALNLVAIFEAQPLQSSLLQLLHVFHQFCGTSGGSYGLAQDAVSRWKYRIQNKPEGL